MQFEVNGQTYFLNFSEEGQLTLVAPTREGVCRISVVDDEGPVFWDRSILAMNRGDENTIN